MHKSHRIEQLKGFLDSDPDDSFVRFALAQEYTKMGTLKAALDAYKYIEQNDPNYVGVYYHLAKLYEELTEPELALDTYEKGIEIAKKIPDFHALSELINAKRNLEIELE